MPRQPRLNIPGLIYHVMGRGIEGCDIFRDDEDREGFLKRLADGVNKPGGPRLYAWTLMSNNFHLLFRAGEELLSTTMRQSPVGSKPSRVRSQQLTNEETTIPFQREIEGYRRLRYGKAASN